MDSVRFNVGAQPGSVDHPITDPPDFSIFERRLSAMEFSIKRLERIFNTVFSQSLMEEEQDDTSSLTSNSVTTENNTPCLETSNHEIPEETENTLPPTEPATMESKTIIIQPSNVAKPRYDGRCEYFTAAEFLNRFDHYVMTAKQARNDEERIEAVYDCLLGEPKLWFRAFRYRFDKWDTFQRLFLMRFWGYQDQRKFMAKLLHGKYEQRGKRRRMAAYFTRLLINAQYLQLPPTEDKLIRTIAEHFPPNVQEVLAYNNDIGSFYNSLVTMDQMDIESSGITSQNDRSGGGSCNVTN